MAVPLAYPDLGEPPSGWTVGKLGHAIQLVPPGAFLDRSRARIVISPIVPRNDRMPAPAELIVQSYEAENRQTGAEVAERAPAAPFTTTAGLEGVRLDVTFRAPTGGLQKRAYVMLTDATSLYGITYLADDVTFPVFADTFERAARSLRPPSPTLT